jgi:hypothetical protein
MVFKETIFTVRARTTLAEAQKNRAVLGLSGNVLSA